MNSTPLAASLMMQWIVYWVVLLAILLGRPGLAGAEDPPKEPPEPPQVLMCVPLGGIPGETIQVKARGLRLEETTDVTSNVEGVAVKFLSSSKVGVPPNLNVAAAGDTQVGFELTLPADAPPSGVELAFVTPHGQATYQLPLAQAEQTILEVEPNPGFDQSQEIGFPQLVLGQIERAQDVDVYAVELGADQRIRIEVKAQAHGSAMDPLLTLTDARGTTMISNDDHAGTRDSRIDTTVATAGRYLIVVQDANDLGGDAHPYRLSVSAGMPPVSFVSQIAPLLQQQCVACHGPSKAEGGYRLDTYQHLIATGDSGEAGFVPHRMEDSESFRRITSEDAGERMPADADALSEEQIALIQTWLEEGAEFDGEDPHVSLSSLIPAVTHPPAPEHYSASIPLSAIAYSPQGDELLVGSYHEITLWAPDQGRLLRRIDQLAQRTYGIAWHPSGDQFAVAGGNPGQLGEVRLFSAAGEPLKVLSSSGDVIHDIAYSPGGDRLAVAGSDGSIRVYDIEHDQLQVEITSHLDWVLAVAWSPDGSKIASGSRDKTAKVFHAETGQLLASYNRHEAAVRGVLFHPSGDEVYSSGENGRWDRWKISEAERVRDMHLGGEAFKLTGVGNYFIVPSANNRVHVMKAQESDRIRELHGSEDARMLSVAAHEPTDRIAAGTQGGEVIVWELSTGKQVAQFRAIPEPSSDF